MNQTRTKAKETAYQALLLKKTAEAEKRIAGLEELLRSFPNTPSSPPAKAVPFINYGQLTKQQIENVAFDPSTPPDVAQELQNVLSRGRKTQEEFNLPEHRIMYLHNPVTMKIELWID